MDPTLLIPLSFTIPWLVVLGYVVFVVKIPRELPSASPTGYTPSVSVIVPARNEAVNIQTCVESVAASDYDDFEIIVVNDRSEDDTGDLARAVPQGRAKQLQVVDGSELPEGWLGKPWACVQGAALATGDLLLFTDADTTHGADLLTRAVKGLEEDGADLLSIMGRQLMESFWERTVQPHVFLTMMMRFPDFEGIAKNGHWREAIANGQYMLFRREAYEAVGGHESVRGRVVEDQGLAQLLKRRGGTYTVRSAADFAIRMYRSLGGLIEGWSKNIVHGGRASVAPLMRPLMVPGFLVVSVALWVVPPVCLLLALVGLGGTGLLIWSASAVFLSVVVIALFTKQMEGPALYGLVYPVGALVGLYIVMRAWVRGARVEWKGREYLLYATGEPD